MTTKFLLLITIAMMALSGCNAVRSSRADGLPLSEVKLDGSAPIVQSGTEAGRYTVRSVEVIVPETLKISEENKFYPIADVVWRGEPQGDRLAQITAILNEGFSAGVAGLREGPAVVVSVQVERFHALTEKARFSVGGTHDIVLLLTVRDAATDAVLEGPRRVEIAIKASGNEKAIAEDAEGRTQRVVIVEGIARAVRDELSGPLQSTTPTKRGLFAGFR